MRWPSAPTIHASEQRIAALGRDLWLPENDDHRGRRCSYCGGVHLEDAARFLLDAAATVEIADLKYGYPHKVYIRNIPIEGAEAERKVRPRAGGGLEEYMGHRGHATLRIRHFCDHGLDAAAFKHTAQALELRTGLRISQADEPGAVFWKFHEAGRA